MEPHDPMKYLCFELCCGHWSVWCGVVWPEWSSVSQAGRQAGNFDQGFWVVRVRVRVTLTKTILSRCCSPPASLGQYIREGGTVHTQWVCLLP